MNNNLPLAIALAAAFVGSAPTRPQPRSARWPPCRRWGKAFARRSGSRAATRADAECFRVVRGSGRRVPHPAAGPRRHCRQRRRRPPGGTRRRARRRAGVEAGDRERVRVAPAARIHPADALRRGADTCPPRQRHPPRRAPPTCQPRGPHGRPLRPGRPGAQTARAHPQHHRRRVAVHPRRVPVSGRQRCAGPLHRGDRRGQPEALHRRGRAHPRPARGYRAAHARPARAGTRPSGRAALVAAPAASQGPDRLVVDKSLDCRWRGLRARQRRATAGRAASAERERALAAAIDRSIIAEMELLARIKELEEIQASLKERVLAMQAAPDRPDRSGGRGPTRPRPPPRREPLGADPAPGREGRSRTPGTGTPTSSAAWAWPPWRSWRCCAARGALRRSRLQAGRWRPQPQPRWVPPSPARGARAQKMPASASESAPWIPASSGRWGPRPRSSRSTNPQSSLPTS